MVINVKFSPYTANYNPFLPIKSFLGYFRSTLVFFCLNLLPHKSSYCPLTFLDFRPFSK